MEVVGKQRLLYLDGIRGFAALMVVLYHVWISAGSPAWRVHLFLLAPTVTVDLLSPIEACGGSRVSLFFVLSGFLLYLPFVRRNGVPEREQESFASWLGRRFRRLAPPYYAALVFALLPVVGSFYLNEAWRVWVHHAPERTPNFANLLDTFPECLFFLHGMVPGSEFPAFNGALWSLTPEVQLYLTFPLLVALARCRTRIGRYQMGGLGVVVTLTVLVSVAYRVWLYEQIGPVPRLESDAALGSAYHCLANTFLGRWAEFALGMGAAGIVAGGRVPSPRLLLPACSLCLGWFLVLRSDIAVGGVVGHLFLAMEPAPSPLADAVGGMAFALFVLCCAAAPRLAHLFSSRWLVFVGTVAYSLYLIHVPTLFWIHHSIQVVLHRQINVGLWAFAINLFVGAPLALLLARVFWAVCERPFLSRNRRLSLPS